MTAANRGQSAGASDVGRRVAQRRRDLGLSRQELAQRARMAESHVAYLEEQAAHVPSIDVSRLASALDTSVDALSGGAVEVPPGQRGPAEEATLETLNEWECRRLLATGGVGRFVFNTQRGPVALPVNYRVMDGDIVFRTAEDTTLTAVSNAESVSFEVDRIDDAMSEGWSVLVTGRVRRVGPDELRQVETAGIQPWPAANAPCISVSSLVS